MTDRSIRVLAKRLQNAEESIQTLGVSENAFELMPLSEREKRTRLFRERPRIIARLDSHQRDNAGRDDHARKDHRFSPCEIHSVCAASIVIEVRMRRLKRGPREFGAREQ
jgi:hypothetical protein